MRGTIIAGLSATVLNAASAAAEETIDTQIMRRIIETTDYYAVGGGAVRASRPSAAVVNSLLANFYISDMSVSTTNLQYRLDKSSISPGQDTIKIFQVDNCTNQQRSLPLTIRETVTVGETISLKTATVDTRNTTNSIKANIGIPFSKSGTISPESTSVQTIQYDFRSETTTNTNRVVDILQTSDRIASANHKLWIGVRYRQHTVSVPFTADFVVDGTINVKSHSLGNANIAGHSFRISALLPTESLRSFAAAGSVQNINVQSDRVRFVETPVSAEDCRADAPEFRAQPIEPNSLPAGVANRLLH